MNKTYHSVFVILLLVVLCSFIAYQVVGCKPITSEQFTLPLQERLDKIRSATGSHIQVINKQLVSLSDYPTIDVSSIDDVKHKLRIFWNSNTDNGTLKVKLKLYGFHENTDHIARNAESTSSIPWDFVTRHTLTITKKAGDKHTDSDDFRVCLLYTSPSPRD